MKRLYIAAILHSLWLPNQNVLRSHGHIADHSSRRVFRSCTVNSRFVQGDQFIRSETVVSGAAWPHDGDIPGMTGLDAFPGPRFWQMSAGGVERCKNGMVVAN